MRDKKTEAMMSIVLELTKNKDDIVGPPVTDEELAAYLEGGLEDYRRAQISTYIANDEEVYSRWMRLVENVEEFDLLPAEDTSPVKASSGFFASISDWISQITTRPALATGGAFSFFAVAFLSYSLYQLNDGLNQLYTDYSTITNPDFVVLPSRSFNPLGSKEELKPEDNAIKTGLISGLTELKVEFEGKEKLLQLPLNETHKGLDQKQIDIYLHLGQWAAITHVHCLNKTPGFAHEAYPVFHNIEKGISGINTPYSKSLEKRLSVMTDKVGADGLCNIASTLFDKVNIE